MFLRSLPRLFQERIRRRQLWHGCWWRNGLWGLGYPTGSTAIKGGILRVKWFRSCTRSMASLRVVPPLIILRVTANAGASIKLCSIAYALRVLRENAGGPSLHLYSSFNRLLLALLLVLWQGDDTPSGPHARISESSRGNVQNGSQSTRNV